jgi:hypothetical protein
MGINNFLHLDIITMEGSEGEVKKIDEVITQETNKIADEVSNKIEELVEKTGIDSALVEPIIDQVTSAAATVVSEGAKAVAEKLGLTLISESSLSDDQKKLATTIYDSVKDSIKDFISDPNVNNTVKITKTLGQVIKQLETTHIDGKVITGADKKAVAIQLGRILIKEVMPDDKGEAEVLMMYDMIAEATLEAMIEVSKVLNVAVPILATKCCPGLLDFFKRAKTTK